MTEKDAENRAPGDIRAEKRREYWEELKRRWPRLELERRDSDARALALLQVDHPLYPVAAWAFHHGDELDESSRSGLYAALEGGWPRGPGRSRTRRVARAIVAVLKEAGVRTELIASGLGRSVGDVQDLLRESAGSRPPSRARITPLETPGGLPKPYDPQTITGGMFARGPDELLFTREWELAEALARKLGFDSLPELHERGL